MNNRVRQLVLGAFLVGTCGCLGGGGIARRSVEDAGETPAPERFSRKAVPDDVMLGRQAAAGYDDSPVPR
jgi:hypothetical protein